MATSDDIIINKQQFTDFLKYMQITGIDDSNLKKLFKKFNYNLSNDDITQITNEIGGKTSTHITAYMTKQKFTTNDLDNYATSFMDTKSPDMLSYDKLLNELKTITNLQIDIAFFKSELNTLLGVSTTKNATKTDLINYIKTIV